MKYKKIEINNPHSDRLELFIDYIHIDFAFKKVNMNKTPGPDGIGYDLL